METIDITILFFGSLKQYFDHMVNYSVKKGTTIGELLKILAETRTGSEKIFDYCQIAINGDIALKEETINASCEIAILPPFSGG